MRISIVGLPASGKTFLANRISEKLSIPHVHLDRYWFESGALDVGHNASEEEKERVRTYIRERALKDIAAESWVSDGTYSRSVPEIAERADTIIFLDISLWRRLLNHAKRAFSNISKRHMELSVWHEITFFVEIIRRQFRSKPRLMKYVNDHRDKVNVLTSREEIEKYLRENRAVEFVR